MNEARVWRFDRFGAPTETLRLDQEVVPSCLPGQAEVAIRAIGLNRADYEYVHGRHFPPDTLPSSLGVEAVGEIVALGPPPTATIGERAFHVGQRVGFSPAAVDRVGMGLFRERGVYNLSSLLPVPDALTDAEAAAWWMAFLVLAGALEMAGLSPESARGKRIALPAAAGAIGPTCLRIARAWGAETLATTRASEKRKRLETFADCAVVAESPEALQSALLAWSHGDGVDVVLDPLGGAWVPAELDGLATGGQLVSYEFVTGPIASLDVPKLLMKDASWHGYSVYRPMFRPDLLNRLIDEGMSTPVHPLITSTYSFGDAPAALESMANGPFGKTVIEL